MNEAISARAVTITGEMNIENSKIPDMFESVSSSLSEVLLLFE